MRKALFLMGFLCFFIKVTGVAQSEDHPHGIAARAVFPNYQWPLKNVSNIDIVDFSSGLEFEYYRYLNEQFNLSFPLRLSNSYLPINENGATYRAGSLGFDVLINYKIIKEGWFRPHAFIGGGVFVEDLKDVSVNIPTGVGLNFQLGRNSFLSTTFVYKIGFKDYRNYLQLGAGLRFNIAPKDKNKEQQTAKDRMKDSDEDGIVDEEDLCPQLAGSPALNGCPDKDNDGVTDENDHCPNIPGSSIFNGCPDKDNDGLIDKEDDCPTLSGPVSNHGCPYGSIKEVDILPQSQKVTNEASDSSISFNAKLQEAEQLKSEIEIENTVQITSLRNKLQDKDGDGVADKDDKCPDLKGSIQTFGCPELTMIDKEIIAEAIETIEFETGSAIITKVSYSILEKVSEVLLRNRAYQLVLSGHTDSIGEEYDNKILSKRRALACYNYLLTKGIARSRMTYAGFGESEPIDNNHSSAGRERNRRVVFELVL